MGPISQPDILREMKDQREYLERRIEKHSERHDDAHTDHENRLRTLEDFRARFLGAVVAASALGGIVSGVITAFIVMMIKHS